MVYHLVMPRNMTREEYNAHMKVYIGQRYHRIRNEAVARLGGKCVQCGSVDDLEFDHIDPMTKVKSFAHIWSYSNDKREAELVKMQLLCKPCHIRKSVENDDYGTGHKRNMGL